jgi:hypothetical protein
METTSKPTFGLPALTPIVNEDKGFFGEELTLSPDITYVSDKTYLKGIGLHTIKKRTKRTNYAYDGSYLRVYVSHHDKDKHGALAEFASRGLESFDDRMKEYRKAFPAIFKTLYANGLLCGENVTAEWLEKPKGVRWAQRAFCRCGCSPSFKLPKGIYLTRWNTADVTLQEKEGAVVEVVTTQERIEVVSQILEQSNQGS